MASQETWCLQLVHEAVENEPVMKKTYQSTIFRYKYLLSSSYYKLSTDYCSDYIS